MTKLADDATAPDAITRLMNSRRDERAAVSVSLTDTLIALNSAIPAPVLVLARVRAAQIIGKHRSAPDFRDLHHPLARNPIAALMVSVALGDPAASAVRAIAATRPRSTSDARRSLGALLNLKPESLRMQYAESAGAVCSMP
jgi:hypothetical protein